MENNLNKVLSIYKLNKNNKQLLSKEYHNNSIKEKIL